jgi:DNA-binding CsgD family transcriptional regulator
MKRKDILSQKDNILNWISEGLPKSVISKNLKCKPETLDNYLNKLGIQYKGNVGRKGFKRRKV